MYALWFMVCLQCSKVESIGYYLWGKKHDNTIHSSRNLEMACCTAQHSCQNLQDKKFCVFSCRGFEKNGISSLGIMKIWLLRTLSLIDKKKILNLLLRSSWLITISASQSSLQPGTWEWLSFYQAGIARHSVFFIQDEKGPILSQTMKDKRKDYAARLLNKLKYLFQMNMLYVSQTLIQSVPV